MHYELNKKFTRLENSTHSIINVLKAQTGDDLNKKPKADKWSPLQILYHIIKVEQMTIISLKRTLTEYDKKETTGLFESLSTALLRLTLITPLKFKAPRAAADVPDQPVLNEMINKWKSLRIDLKSIFETIPEAAMKKNLFKHPYAGKMNIFQTMDFLVSHSEHHHRQIKKLIRRS